MVIAVSYKDGEIFDKEQIIKMNELLCKFENDEIEINNIDNIREIKIKLIKG